MVSRYLAADPVEATNRAAENPNKVTKLFESLKEEIERGAVSNRG